VRLDVFERSLQKAGAWLDDLMARLEWDDRHQTYEAFGVVLHTFRDRLPLAQAVSLGAQLPLLLRGLYYQGWDVSSGPQKYRHVQDLLSRIRGGLLEHRLEFVPEERLVQAVLDLLRAHVSPGEIQGIRRALPPEIRSLFDAGGATPEDEKRWFPKERPWDRFLT
jgi:uncharacterized protein (DUF2267 family)